MGGGYHGGFGRGKPKTTDFYVGSNRQVLPAKFKHWIGVSRRDALLRRAKNVKLKNAINEMYRRGSFIGDGGTASVLKFEKRTGTLLTPKGHYQKAKEMKRYLEKIISRESLDKKDIKLAKTFIKQLRRAILEWEEKV